MDKNLSLPSLIFGRMSESYNLFSGAVTFLGIIFTIFGSPSNITIREKCLVVVLLLIIYLLILSTNSLLWLYRQRPQSSTTVDAVLKGENLYLSYPIVLIAKPSQLFSQDCIVSIYQQREYEVFMAAGKVLIIEDSGKIQIAVIHSQIHTISDASFFDLLQTNINSLRIKPNCPSFMIPAGGER